MTTTKPTTDETCPDCGRELNANDECPWIAAQRAEIADHNMLTTKPTSAESPEQIAERLLPCCQADPWCVQDGAPTGEHYQGDTCHARYRKIFAAALRAERERIVELERENQRLSLMWGANLPATCDWGDCDEKATGYRYDAEGHGWLPVCDGHNARVAAERERALEEAARIVTRRESVYAEDIVAAIRALTRR